MTEEVWLDGSKHEVPVGVVIEALWAAPNDENDFPIRGWLRHDAVKCRTGEYHIIGPTSAAIMIRPDFWRVQTGVPPAPMQG